ncbi:hypothetical protein [Amycolatopsis benzoatilytica]|uniref:hypothetical protein n=1 Tax=Amycolatopsis benzoatilytica TaxID=346045 RepID=UPI0012B68D8F|nr:hypothetical protein [Amycolatopsis benzoatilytica]
MSRRQAVPAVPARARHRRPRTAQREIVRHLRPVRGREVRPEHDPVRVRERLSRDRHLAIVLPEQPGCRRGAA